MAIRASGSFRRYYIPGLRLRSDDEAIYEKLRQNRFKSIDDQPVSEPSVGWVAAQSFASSDFRPDTVFFGPVIRLRMRIDVKKLPTNAVKLRVHEALRETGAKKVAKAAKDKIREEIEKELLGRTVPGTKLVDAYWRPMEQVAMLATTSQQVHELFSALFKRTFGATPEPATPFAVAEKRIGKEIGVDRLKRLNHFLIAESDAE